VRGHGGRTHDALTLGSLLSGSLFLASLEYDRLHRHPERIRTELSSDCRCQRINDSFDGYSGALLNLGSKRTTEDCSSSKDCGRRYSGLQADNRRTDAGEPRADQRLFNWIDLMIVEWSGPSQPSRAHRLMEKTTEWIVAMRVPDIE